MRLSDHFREDLVVHGFQADDSRSALKVFGAQFEEGGYVNSAEDAFQALQTREESHTTCLGHGVAVPHGTVATLSEPLLLVATAAEPIAFGPPDTEPVNIFFVLLSPPGRQGTHIKLLARICRLAQHPEDLELLAQSKNTESLYRAVLHIDSRHV